MLYPFFQCVSCHARVQKAVPYSRGMLPNIVVFNKSVLLSDGFEGTDYVNFCRGQGRRVSLDLVPFSHFNFSGCFDGHCCFCALHSGFGEELFMDVACDKCIQKEMMRKMWSRLYTASGSLTWESHGWAALPSSILDKILHNIVLMSVRDACIMKLS